VRAGALQYPPSSFTAVLPPASGSNTAVTLPALNVDTSVATPGSITFNLSALTPGRYDKGQVVVARYGMIVNTQSIDSALASNGGAVTMSNLPAGAATKPNAGAVYYAYLRVWNSNTPNLRPRVIPVLSFADLRTSSSAAMNVTLP
jgi:hypothetical protein